MLAPAADNQDATKAHLRRSYDGLNLGFVLTLDKRSPDTPLDAAPGQLDEDEDREPGQSARCPDLDGEEVGGGKHVPMSGEKLQPSRALHPLGRGFQAVFLEHVGDGAPRDLVTEVVEGTPNA